MHYEHPFFHLKPGGTLTIGYGAGSDSALHFSCLAKGQDIAVDFVKLLLSTKPPPRRSMEQSSPFETNFKRVAREPCPDPWGTTLVPVIRRRYPKTYIEGKVPQCHGPQYALKIAHNFA